MIICVVLEQEGSEGRNEDNEMLLLSCMQCICKFSTYLTMRGECGSFARSLVRSVGRSMIQSYWRDGCRPEGMGGMRVLGLSGRGALLSLERAGNCSVCVCACVRVCVCAREIGDTCVCVCVHGRARSVCDPDTNLLWLLVMEGPGLSRCGRR